MKRFFTTLTAFSLIETIGRHPAIAAGVLTLLGVGCGVATMLTTPVLLPQVSSNFNPSQAIGTTNNGLEPNGGTPGSIDLPPGNTGGATGSFALGFEMQIDPALGYANGGAQVPFLGSFLLANASPGQPTLLFQKTSAAGNNWLNMSFVPPGSIPGGAVGSNYATGLYPFQMSGGGCVREPAGVLQGGSPVIQIVDPGFGCSSTPTFNAATVPGLGAQQNTNAGGLGTTCSATSGEMVVTAHVAVAHGLSPGLQYTMQSFTPTGYNVTYTALPGTTGTTLVGTPTTTTASCPAVVSTEGTALSGTGATFAFPAISTTNPFGGGGTGITTKNGQHICGIIGEYGDDSPFPGAQFVSMVDEKGAGLPGSPALAQIPNMGTANFTGFTTVSSATMNVTSMNAWPIVSAAWSSTVSGFSGLGLVTFQMGASNNPGYIPGSEFTVSGMSPSSVNGTYIAVAGTSATQVIGNQLTAPGGVPQVFANPGAITTATSPQMISVIFPGMQVWGTTGNTYILPYGSAGTTGTGSNAPATYQLGASQTSAISSGSTIFAWQSFYYSGTTGGSGPGGITLIPRSQSAIGDFTGLIGANFNFPFGGAPRISWGGSLGNFSMLWGVLPSQTGGAPSTSDLASLCTKTTDIQAYAKAKSIKVSSLYRLNDLGIWGDSGNATITGHITNVGGSAATLVIDSTPYGSLALATGTETAKLTGVGLPVASPVTIPLTTTCSPGTGPLCVGATYAITPNTTAALGSSISPVTFAVGAFAPALPVQSNTLKGYIDTTAGVSTLHVTSLDDGTVHSGFSRFTGTLGTSFTAQIDNGSGTGAGNILTTSTGGSPPQNAYVGVGTVVCPAVGTSTFTCATVTALGTGLGYNGTYTINGAAQNIASQVMFGSGQLPGPATTLQTAGVTGGPGAGEAVTGASLTGSPLLITGGGGSVFNVVGNYYAPISADATMIASLSTLIPGEYLQNSTDTHPIVNPVKIVAFQPLANACNAAISGAYNGGPGCYTLSGSPNASNAVGSSGSPATFLGTTITDGGAIAPGPALTIRDQGPSITFPINDFVHMNGQIALSGTYDTGTLGGTPSAIQVLVSNSANGPPLAGCTPCNWSALTTGTISGGAWSGTLAGIPGGGPYFVSVRAANGTAYATLPSPVKVGLIYALYGQGQADSMQGAQAGANISYFSGFWGLGSWVGVFGGAGGDTNYVTGPPVTSALVPTSNFVPSQAVGRTGDRFGVTFSGGPLSEAVGAFDQNLTNAFGVPATFLSATRDGVGIGISTLGGATQEQTVGAGNGATLIWCSASKFCASAGVSPSGPLVFNAASLTGAWFNGSVSSTTLTVTTRYGGAIEPGMTLGATGSPTIIRCLTNCSNPLSIDGSTWLLSSNAASGATGTLAVPLRADPVGSMIPFGGTTTPWPNLNIQQQGGAFYGFGGFGWPLVKAGTFTVSVNGTVVCQDSGSFAYANTGGNCTGANIASSFVNYQTGDYQITFTSGNAPASSAAIVASWTNIISPETILSTLSRPENLDFFGDGTPQSGPDSALFAKAPGGVNGHIYSGEGTDKNFMMNTFAGGNAFEGYQYGGLAYSEMISHLYGVKFPALIPGAMPGVSFITTGQWRVEGPQAFTQQVDFLDGVHDQWTQDVVTKSLFSGSITTGVLTLSGAATGPMWEGEVLGCVTLGGGCTVGPLSGIYITSLAGGTWGASGSSYNLANASGVSSTGAMQNPVYYSGQGPAFYAGTLNDIIVQSQSLAGTTSRNPHPTNGFTGGRRATSRWAAMIWEQSAANPNQTTDPSGADPKVDRVKADAVGCDAAAAAAPCFDVGTTYQATFSTATWAGNTVTITGGLAAHARPFVVGQAFTCSGCNSGLVITSLSVPPTQSTATGAGEVGQTFTFQVANASGQAIGRSGSGAVAGGCSGTSGTGSNCIDIAISLNVSSATAIDTCGAGNLNGNAPNYVVPNGKCQGNGIGEIVRAFRIGTTQLMYGNGPNNPLAGSVFDDGVDISNGQFTQNSAFTCNIVRAKVVQCVKAPTYASGVFSSAGRWLSAIAGVPQTFISYGDLTVVSGRVASVLGNVGGQSFPFTAGSGYTNGTTTVTATCTTITGTGAAPRFDVTVAGGSIVDVYPSAATTGNSPVGLGIGSTCTVPLPSGGTGGAIATIPLAPPEGFGGVATYNTDSNTMGMFLYDNSGKPGNPLNSFFTNGQGGYFEPGLPVRPFGLFQGLAVSDASGGSACNPGLQFNQACNSIFVMMRRA